MRSALGVLCSVFPCVVFRVSRNCSVFDFPCSTFLFRAPCFPHLSVFRVPPCSVFRHSDCVMVPKVLNLDDADTTTIVQKRLCVLSEIEETSDILFELAEAEALLEKEDQDKVHQQRKAAAATKAERESFKSDLMAKIREHTSDELTCTKTCLQYADRLSLASRVVRFPLRENSGKQKR